MLVGYQVPRDRRHVCDAGCVVWTEWSYTPDHWGNGRTPPIGVRSIVCPGGRD